MTNLRNRGLATVQSLATVGAGVALACGSAYAATPTVNVAAVAKAVVAAKATTVAQAKTSVTPVSTPAAKTAAGTPAAWGTIANQNGRFTVTGTKTIRFGIGSSWIEKTMIGTGTCDSAFFGGDPAPTSSKVCQGPTPVVVPPLRPAPVPTNKPATGSSPQSTWVKIASDGAAFQAGSARTIRYGTGTTWIEKSVTGTAHCNASLFGGDPAPGKTKQCEASIATSPQINLATLSTPASAVMQYVGPTALCGQGFTPGPALTASTPMSIPTGGGAFFASTDVTRWKIRIAGSPFVSNNDYKTGSPGDWARILANANTFKTTGEIPLTPSSMPQEGLLARDAAYAGYINNDASLISAVRTHLLAMAQQPTNNFATTLCYRAFDGSAPGGDAWMNQAIWINRYAIMYDLIRSKLSTSDRLIVENWLRTQAYFFAGELDYDLQALFPNRLNGDYSVRQRDASPTDGTPYMSAIMDTNGDCYVNSGDNQTPFPVYAYVNASGQFGPKISVLSQWYNNRRGDLAAAIGNVGTLLNDTTLINRVKRYYMEWLTWAVYGDGSEGEYARAGNYCTPQQGLIYAQGNIQPMLQLATWLKARGDTNLVDFYTTDGSWGTEVATGPAKNMELVVATQLKLFLGTQKWYQPEPWLATQNPRSATFIGAMTSHYMNSGPGIDNYQELGLLIGEYVLPNQPIRGLLLRQAGVTNLPFPTATGNSIATGKGVWADVFGGLPAMMLWEL